MPSFRASFADKVSDDLTTIKSVLLKHLITSTVM